MPDRPVELRAEADRIDTDSRRYATTRPLVYHVGQACARLIRWRAADLEAYATPAGRRRSARRWILAAIVLATLAVADKLAYYWWHWLDLSPVLNLATFIAMGVFAQARGWADGYEARQREER